jgi:biopolymer transport protein ExbD
MRHHGEEHMAATVQSKSGEIVADMNTTPLIDVMLVLQTLLIITLPMQTHAIKIAMPEGLPAGPPPPVVTLGIDFDGSTSWNGTVVDRATLESYLADAARKNPQPDIIIRADRLTKYDRVATVLSEAARAGEMRIGFAQEQ